jgi:hypothetical protein
LGIAHDKISKHHPQMLLPGTVNIGSLEESKFDGEQLRNMTNLRMVAVPINMNGNYKRCDCEEGITKETNYVVHHPIKVTVATKEWQNDRIQNDHSK